MPKIKSKQKLNFDKGTITIFVLIGFIILFASFSFAPFALVVDGEGGSSNSIITDTEGDIDPLPNNNDIVLIGNDGRITYDWLSLSIGDSNNPQLKHSIGGIDLIEYENLGSQASGNTFVFSARIKFGFEMNSFLALDIKDVFPNFNPDEKTEWSTYANIWILDGIITIAQGSFRYQYINTNGMNSHDVDTQIPLSISINPTFSSYQGQTIEGITISDASYLYEVKNAQVVKNEYGICGDYKDSYTDQKTVSGSVSFSEVNDNPLIFSKTYPTLEAEIKRQSLGWKTAYTDEYIDEGITLNQLSVYSNGIGTTTTNPSTGALTLYEDIILKPEITKTEQRIDVRANPFISYNALFDSIIINQPTYAISLYRTLSTHVTCPYIHKEYETDVYLLSTVQLSAEEYSSALANPDFVKGDWMWNPIIQSFDPTINYSQINMLIIIIVVLIIVVIVGIWIWSKFRRPKITVNMSNKKTRK